MRAQTALKKFFFKPGSVDSVLDSLGSGLGLALNSTKVV